MGLVSAWHDQLAQVIACPVLNKQPSTICLEQAAEHGTSQSGGERATKQLCKVPAGPGIPLNSDWLLLREERLKCYMLQRCVLSFFNSCQGGRMGYEIM